VTFGERKQLLAYLAKQFREEASKYEEFLRLPTPASGLLDIFFFYFFK
jgi:hypothetical protein